MGKARVIAAVEEILHDAGDGGEVFRGYENIGIGGEEVVWVGVARVQDAGGYGGLGRGALRRGVGHLGGAAGEAVIDDEQRGH